MGYVSNTLLAFIETVASLVLISVVYGLIDVHSFTLLISQA